MNRIQTLEADLQRSATRLGGRARPAPGKAVTAADAARDGGDTMLVPPGATPAVVAPEPTATQSSVAGAMSAWRGRTASTGARAFSRRVGRGGSRSFSVTLDYRVPDLPMPIQQTSSMVCWAFVATMMASWRDRTSHTVDGYVGSLGEPWISKLKNNSGLTTTEAPQLLATMGLQIETTPANFTADQWEDMLRDWGPLWVTADNNHAPQVQGVHAHILVGIHGPSDGDPTVDVIDPALGREVQMPMSQLAARYEQLAGTAFAGLQVRHWPARAQQAAQQSMSWARQELARRSGAFNAGAVIAGAGLLFTVFKELVTTRDLRWHKSELRGKVIPGNIEANKPLADQGTYQSKRFKSLKRLAFWEPIGEDNVGAEFEVSYEYNGTCVANVRMTNTSYAPPNPLAGRGVSVDSNITQAFADERGNIAAVEVEIVYQFSAGSGSAGTFTQRYVIFGDGRQEQFTETRS
jgi:hypothetical protein